MNIRATLTLFSILLLLAISFISGAVISSQKNWFSSNVTLEINNQTGSIIREMTVISNVADIPFIENRIFIRNLQNNKTISVEMPSKGGDLGYMIRGTQSNGKEIKQISRYAINNEETVTIK